MRFGVLGLGSIGLRHAANLHQSLGEDVVGYDPSGDRQVKAEQLGIKIVSTRGELLNSADAILICSPTKQHIEDLRDSVAFDKHVFVEKPIGHLIEGLEKILKDASKKRLVIFAGFPLRFNPAVREMKKLLTEKAVGEILWALFQSSHFLPDWRPGQDYRSGYTADKVGGGVILDIIHEFDLATFLLGPGKPMACVARNTGFLDIETEDCADIIMVHEKGIQSNIHLDYVSRPTRRKCLIGGEGGILCLDLLSREVKLVGPDGLVLEKRQFADTTFETDFVQEMEAFVNCVQNGSDPECSGIEALEVLKQAVESRKLAGLAN